MRDVRRMIVSIGLTLATATAAATAPVAATVAAVAAAAAVGITGAALDAASGPAPIQQAPPAPAASAATPYPVKELFDTSKPQTVQGRIKLVWYPAGQAPTVFLMETTGTGGAVRQWVVTGHPPRVLQRSGWQPRAVTGGVIVTVSLYPAKPGTKAIETLMAAYASTPDPRMGFIEEAKKPAGRLGYGYEIALPDGRTLTFGEKQ